MQYTSVQISLYLFQHFTNLGQNIHLKYQILLFTEKDVYRFGMKGSKL